MLALFKKIQTGSNNGAASNAPPMNAAGMLNRIQFHDTNNSKTAKTERREYTDKNADGNSKDNLMSRCAEQE
jgi:hypothetical protein